MRKKALTYTVSALLLAAVGIACWQFLTSPEHRGASTETFFAAVLADVEGGVQPMSQWKGKTIVVNFWATWCPPCLEEMPELSRVHDRYRDQGLVVLGISSDDIDSIRRFTVETPISYPLLSAELEAMPLSETLGNNKGVLPYTVVIAPDGRVEQSHFGKVDQALLERMILPLLPAAD
ncbi:MAG TPA: TlpA disulfide reductase family protein [Methylophilaceae bacterium]|jgi:peroxiredoxin